ncbi:nitroreductase family protein [Nocardioides sp. WL0053]|jgi:nitroreductase|uniref:Nitroreductase family protein n=1 Tax=Nocardioides jiangsuensis TaxID=2866161 RepID=A0ABS7RFY8_9ACTN|nr:nitroreductase family protein [Nocardioides jiangsuensis]MBY9073951.1 nitroreductase family protein [Nocardioides jiangsuensis]
MEFQDVVRRRRMVRTYSDEPVDPDVVERILANALHAPSAGFTQGWAFLLLDTAADVDRFWSACTPEGAAETPDSWLRGMRTAPVVIVPLSNKSAYLGRYAEADKGWTDRDEARWPVPYWHMDTAMASLLMLLTAVDARLGACFFGIPGERTAAFRAEFGVPEEYTPVGAITLGHRTGSPGGRGSAGRGRRPVEEVVHRGGW